MSAIDKLTDYETYRDLEPGFIEEFKSNLGKDYPGDQIAKEIVREYFNLQAQSFKEIALLPGALPSETAKAKEVLAQIWNNSRPDINKIIERYLL